VTPVNDGELHEILAIRRGSSLELYVDRGLEATAPLGPIGTTNNDNLLVIGGRTLAGTGCSFDDDFLGEIAEVRLYDVAVTAAQPVPALPGLALAALGVSLLGLCFAKLRQRERARARAFPQRRETPR
jgi:hypothetical protein